MGESKGQSEADEYILGEDITHLFRSKEPIDTVVVSFRMPAADFESVADAADARGESLSQYIRDALHRRLGATPTASVE